MAGTRWLAAALTACLVAVGAVAGAADTPDSWDGLLGRVVDRRETRSSATMQQASRVTNQADFRALFSQWASIVGKGLDELKAVSPVPETLTPGQKLK